MHVHASLCVRLVSCTQATYGGPKVLRLQPRSSSEPAGARAARATAWSDVPDTVPDRSMPDFPPERSVPDRVPERSMPDRVPERSMPDRVPERSVPDRMPERSVLDRMPERSVPDRLPERYVPERVSERFMPDRMVECSIPDRKDPWAEGQPGRSAEHSLCSHASFYPHANCGTCYRPHPS